MASRPYSFKLYTRLYVSLDNISGAGLSVRTGMNTSIKNASDMWTPTDPAIGPQHR